MRILLTGEIYHGGNAGGLSRAFRRLGHLVQTVNTNQYFTGGFDRGFLPRAIRRLCMPLSIREFGREILRQNLVFRPHLAVVFKGTFVEPRVLRELKQEGVYLMNFFPDVSFLTHGPLIPQCLPLYDRVFTTKTFGVADMKARLGIVNVEFLPHGFDPDLHRPLQVDQDDLARLGADASFIGTWSLKKERYLSVLADALPDIHFRIWGGQWDKANTPCLEEHIMGSPIYGDIYPLTIQCSKINIALLSEAVPQASSGDLITSRTFHIPASAGFMLHERTDQLLEYYKEGEQVACFATPEELVEKVRYYLEHKDERERIRLAGHDRCVAENSLKCRAETIVEHYRSCSKSSRGCAHP